MNPITSSVDQDRETWIEHHRGFTGGSGITDILGIEIDGREPAGLWWRWVFANPSAWEAIGEHGRSRYREIEDRIARTINVEARLALEPVIERWAATKEGVTIWDPGAYCILRDQNNPRRGISPDGLVLHPANALDLGAMGAGPEAAVLLQMIEAIAEYKTVHPFAAYRWGPEDPGQYALVQATWGMVVTGAEWALIAAQIGLGDTERERLTYRVRYHEDLAGELVEANERFWGYVDRDEEPPPDGLSRTTEAIRLLHPSLSKGRGTMVTLPPDGGWVNPKTEQAESYAHLAAMISSEKRIIKELERSIKMREQGLELAALAADENAQEVIIPPASSSGSERRYRRSNITIRPRVCSCGEQISAGGSYTRFQPVKGA